MYITIIVIFSNSFISCIRRCIGFVSVEICSFKESSFLVVWKKIMQCHVTMGKDAIVSCLCWALHPTNDWRHSLHDTLTRALQSKFASLSMSDQEDLKKKRRRASLWCQRTSFTTASQTSSMPEKGTPRSCKKALVTISLNKSLWIKKNF